MSGIKKASVTFCKHLKSCIGSSTSRCIKFFGQRIPSQLRRLQHMSWTPIWSKMRHFKAYQYWVNITTQPTSPMPSTWHPSRRRTWMLYSYSLHQLQALTVTILLSRNCACILLKFFQFWKIFSICHSAPALFLHYGSIL